MFGLGTMFIRTHGRYDPVSSLPESWLGLWATCLPPFLVFAKPTFVSFFPLFFWTLNWCCTGLRKEKTLINSFYILLGTFQILIKNGSEWGNGTYSIWRRDWGFSWCSEGECCQLWEEAWKGITSILGLLCKLLRLKNLITSYSKQSSPFQHFYLPTFRWEKGGRWQEGRRAGKGSKSQTSINLANKSSKSKK